MVRSTLAWGPVALALACGASHRGSGDGNEKHAASGADAGTGTTFPAAGEGNGGSMGRSGAGGSGGGGGAPAAGRSGGAGMSPMASGAGGVGTPSAGTGGNFEAGSGGVARGGSSGSTLGGTAGAAGTGAVDGSDRLTELHGDDKYRSATVYAISGDGTYVSGSLTDGSVLRAVRWQNDAPTIFETPSDWLTVYGVSIAEDGSKVAGYATALEYGVAFAWDETGVHELPGLDADMHVVSNSMGVAISGDGHVVVGSSTPESKATSIVRWTDDAIDVLPLPENFNSARATSVNRDGTVIVGYGQVSSTTGIRWTEAGAEPYGENSVTVNDVSADGLWIVGAESTVDGATGARPTRAVRYGPNGTEYLPDPDGRGWNCTAQAVSGDGSVVIGTCSEPVGNVIHPYPFLFNPERGSVPLDAVLQAVGVDITAYDSFRLVDVSSDGTTLLAGYWKNSTEAGLRIRIAGAFP